MLKHTRRASRSCILFNLEDMHHENVAVNGEFDISRDPVQKIKLNLSSQTNTALVLPTIVSLYTQELSNGELWSYFMKGVLCFIVTSDAEKKTFSSTICYCRSRYGYSQIQPLSRSVHYRATQKNFHTFHFKDQHYLLAGQRFLNEPTANRFLTLVLNNLPKSDLPKEIVQKTRKKSTSRKVSKEEISTSCMFQHEAGTDDPLHNQRTEEEENPVDISTREKSATLGQNPTKRPSWSTHPKLKARQRINTFS